MSDARPRRVRDPASSSSGGHAQKQADAALVSAGDAGRWDLGFRPWRWAIAPSADSPAAGVAWGEFPVRAIAFLVDVLLIQLVTSNVGQAMAWVISQTVLKTSGVSDPTLSAWVGSGVPVFTLLVVQAAAFVYFWRVFRASPGQMTVGLFTLSSRDGRTLSKGRAFVRWLLLYMPAWVLAGGSALAVLLSFGVNRSIDQSTVSGLTLVLPIIWYVVLAISIGLSSRGRGLHDVAAASVVVRADG
jgi:uncharacterized RDD family membrane protein YckC